MNEKGIKNNYSNKERNRKILISVLINAVILLGMLVFMNSIFETNDDRDMSNILSGGYGRANSSYSVFINIFLSKIFSMFYLLNDSINWYVICCFALSCIAFIVITYTILDRFDYKVGLPLSLIVIGIFFKDQYILFQFTKNAAFYTAAGLFGILAQVNKNKKDNIILWLSAILVLIGSMVRFKASVSALAIFVPILCYLLFVRLKKSNFKIKDAYRLDRAFFNILIILPILCGGIFVAHNQVYARNPEWKEYLDYNKHNFTYLGSDFPEYSEHALEFSALGLSENDYKLYTDWSVGDKSKFSIETMDKMLEIKKADKNQETSKPEFKQIVTTLDSKAILVVVAISILVTLLLTNNIGKGLTIGVIGFTLLEFTYLILKGRIFHRVSYGIYSGLFFSLLYILFFYAPKIVDLAKKYSKYLVVGLSVFVVILGSYENKKISEINYDYKNGSRYTYLMDEAKANKNLLYLVDRPTLTYLAMNGANPLKTYGEDAFSNINILGGWIALTPVNQYALEPYGLSNGYEAIANLENVRIVDDRHIDMILEYAKQNYNMDLQVVLDKEISTLKVYRVEKVQENINFGS